MRINTNISSLQAQEAAMNTNKNLSSSLEKLSTGLKINKAADDASGLAIADKLRTQATSIGQGISNANSASALIQIADKALAEQSTILDTVKAKLIQAGTATTTEAGREAIRKDITKLLSQVDEIAKQTNYNGLTLLQKSATETSKADTLTFQLGEKADFDVNLEASSASNTVNLGGGAAAFGASSINASVTTANIAAANGVNGSLDGSGTEHNNIGTNGSQQINVTGDVTLTAVSINATNGKEGAANTYNVDVTLSGQVGNMIATGADINYYMDNQTQEAKDFAKAAAALNAEISWDAVNEVMTVTDGNSVDFGDIDVSGMRATDSLTGGGSITSLELNRGGRTDENNNSVDSVITIQNNVGQKIVDTGGTDFGQDGQLNVDAGNYVMTGGKLLSDLKNLDAGELTNAAANEFMATVDEAITQLNANRADFGSSQNQIQSSLRSMQTTQVNLLAAESVIRDVDYAQESANFNKQNIIAQAGTYAMSQANAVSQNVLRLLQ